MQQKEVRIGVYVCHCGTNIAATVDVEKVRDFAAKLPHVIICRDYSYMCSEPGQKLIKEDIKEYGLNRVVVAACSPRMHELTFRRVLEDSGLNAYCFEMANIREHCSWVHLKGATEKAKDLIAASVFRAALLEPLESVEVSVTPTALVIGGGISGIQAALDIAEEGFDVYVVEKEPSIGGHMAQLDKTFPTLDCAACILTPKMVELVQHPNIKLLTYSEVVDVEGYVGNFVVKVKKKPRYVDENKCTGCGLCADACRLKKIFANEFDLGLGKRSVPYIPFPYAVPAAYTIDPDHCLMITKGKCGKRAPCLDACGPGAIDFEQEEEIIALNVGVIVVATGYDLFDPLAKPEYGYEHEGVITGLEFERLCSASGPTWGEIKIDGKEPRKVVFIQCVGSRDREGSENEYCSRVCCMYTAKQAYLLKEKIPDADVTIFYTDVRAFGRGFEEFYVRVKEEGVEYIRRELEEPIEVRKKEREKGNVVVIAVCEGRLVEREADLVVLAIGLVPKEDVMEMTHILKINRKRNGFFLEAHPKLRPVDTLTDGIFLAGCCQYPKDIPDSVAQASAAASRACNILFSDYVEIEPIISSVDEERCVGCGICQSVCPFGAISVEEIEERERRKAKAKVTQVMCKGCGVCAASCIKRAITMQHFTDAQLIAQERADWLLS
jgi:heterodisulfide reductase subunit A